MEMSEQINELATALSKAQKSITGALKDSTNPFYTSKYADLASCWDAAREALTDNGLSVVQTTKRGAVVVIEWDTTDQKTGDISNFKVETVETVIETLLMHSSGQWIRSELPMVPRDITPQGVGSAITYGRRYGFSAMTGVAQVDDDGNQASGRNGGGQNGIHSPKGEVGKDVPVDVARRHALAMIAIIEKPAKDGDHDEVQKSLEALDYHDNHLAGNNEIYVAAGEQMGATKKNIWSALVRKAKVAQAADRAVSNARR